MAADALSCPPTPPDPLSVRCPVPYCNSEPWRKCCDKRGVTLGSTHTHRRTLAQVRAKPATEKEGPTNAPR